jgi:hypothetical protein
VAVDPAGVAEGDRWVGAGRVDRLASVAAEAVVGMDRDWKENFDQAVQSTHAGEAHKACLVNPHHEERQLVVEGHSLGYIEDKNFEIVVAFEMKGADQNLGEGMEVGYERPVVMAGPVELHSKQSESQ